MIAPVIDQQIKVVDGDRTHLIRALGKSMVATGLLGEVHADEDDASAINIHVTAYGMASGLAADVTRHWIMAAVETANCEIHWGDAEIS